MFIGEAPGYNEEQLQKCWVGKAGRELKRYARQAGIDIRDCRLTNLVKHRPTTRAKSGNVKPTAADIRRDEGELVDELESVRPTFVGAVGAVAARWLLGREVFSSMEDCHGFCYPTANWRATTRNPHDRNRRLARGPSPVRPEPDGVLPVERSRDERMGEAERLISVAHFTVVPIYHPAAGLHSPEQQPVIFADFMTFGAYISGRLPLETPRDLYPDPDYYEPRGAVKLVDTLPVAIDTEGLAGRVWGLSFSQFGGSAGVVRATNKRALASIKEQLLG